MSFHNCPYCTTDSMTYISGITNLHLTGDPKRVRIFKCDKCSSYFMFISLSARTGGGINDLLFRIEITTQEQKELSKLMVSCPESGNEDCKCEAHGKIDVFEMENTNRRVLIYDDYDLWVSK